jgi:hypothetical protein
VGRRDAEAGAEEVKVAAASLALALALAVASDACACGVCDEDKVAAVYDHAVVTGALARRQIVVFAEVAAPGDPDAAVGRLRQAAQRVRGIERESVRAAASPAVLSFALDPGVQSAAAALAALERSGRERAVTLRLLKILS